MNNEWEQIEHTPEERAEIEAMVREQAPDLPEVLVQTRVTQELMTPEAKEELLKLQKVHQDKVATGHGQF